MSIVRTKKKNTYVFFKVRLVEEMEKFVNRKLWNDGKIERYERFSFPLFVFGWRSRKVKG